MEKSLALEVLQGVEKIYIVEGLEKKKKQAIRYYKMEGAYLTNITDEIIEILKEEDIAGYLFDEYHQLWIDKPSMDIDSVGLLNELSKILYPEEKITKLRWEIL